MMLESLYPLHGETEIASGSMNPDAYPSVYILWVHIISKENWQDTVLFSEQIILAGTKLVYDRFI